MRRLVQKPTANKQARQPIKAAFILCSHKLRRVCFVEQLLGGNLHATVYLANDLGRLHQHARVVQGSHAYFHVNALASDKHRLGKHMAQFLLKRHGIRFCCIIGHHNKLHAARAKHARYSSHTRHDAPGNLGNHVVARIVAELAVYLGYMVDFQANQPNGTATHARFAQCRHQPAIITQARGRVGHLSSAAVDNVARVQRGHAVGPFQAKTTRLAQHVLAGNVLCTVLDAVAVHLAAGHTLNACSHMLAIVGMNNLKPHRNGVVHVLARQTEITHGKRRPVAFPRINVVHKRIAALRRHGKRLEHAIIQVVKHIRCTPARILRRSMFVRELVVVHFTIGIKRGLPSIVPSCGVSYRAAVTKRKLLRSTGFAASFDKLRTARLKAALHICFRGNRRQHHKLVAANAENLFGTLAAFLQVVAYRFNVAVALRVAKTVVARLQVVDINERSYKRLPVLPIHFNRAVERSPVAHPGKRINVRTVLQGALLLQKLRHRRIKLQDVVTGKLLVTVVVRIRRERLCQRKGLRKVAFNLIKRRQKRVVGIKARSIQGLNPAIRKVVGKLLTFANILAKLHQTLPKRTLAFRKRLKVKLCRRHIITQQHVNIRLKR